MALARATTETVVGPVDLTVSGDVSQFDMRLRILNGIDIRSVTGAADSDVFVELSLPRTAYVVLMTLQGRLVVQHGAAYLDAGPGAVTAVSPDQDISFLPLRNCVWRLARVEPELMHERWAGLAGRRPDGFITFNPGLAGLAGAGNPLTKSVARLLDWIEPDALLRHSEEKFVDWLLRNQIHQYTGLLGEGAVFRANDLAVRFVKVLMGDDPRGGREMADYARAAGVSQEELTTAFVRHLGCRPDEYLRGVRLDFVRRDLLAGLGTVRSVAGRWGFRDNLQFRRWYFDRFKEWPGADS